MFWSLENNKFLMLCRAESKLQLVQNFAARVLTDTKKFDHISPVLRELGWPSIKDQLLVRDTTQQIQNKIKQNC